MLSKRVLFLNRVLWASLDQHSKFLPAGACWPPASACWHGACHHFADNSTCLQRRGRQNLKGVKCQPARSQFFESLHLPVDPVGHSAHFISPNLSISFLNPRSLVFFLHFAAFAASRSTKTLLMILALSLLGAFELPLGRVCNFKRV